MGNHEPHISFTHLIEASGRVVHILGNFKGRNKAGLHVDDKFLFAS